MTHYIVNYSKLTPMQSHAEALNDIVQFLGGKRFAKLHNCLISERDCGWFPTLEAFEFYIAFVGVQGYPARVWFSEIFPFG